MADKMVSGIGRELRYFEYKLRKKNKKTSKNPKKDKAGNFGGELAWSDSPRSDDLRFTPTDEEVRKAMPSDKGEEELQMQIALAESREEEQERARQMHSDDLRLKMALEESKTDVIAAKTAAQPSLLDLSMNAPKPVAQPAGNSLFGSTAASDPWGGAAAPTSTPATFDPFASQQVSRAPVASMSGPYSLAANNSAWGTPQNIVPAMPVPVQDPWGNGQSFIPQANAFPVTQASNNQSFTPQANAFPATQASNNPSFTPQANAFSTTQASNNSWGAEPTQNPFPPAQNGGAWGSPDPFLSTQPAPAYDPFSGTISQTTQSQPLFGMRDTPVAPARTQAIDPFGANTSNMPPLSQTSTFGMHNSLTPTTQVPVNDPFGMPGSSAPFTAPPFDPLKDFDDLHIGMNNGYLEPDPVMLQRDFSSGRSVAKDLFPLSQVLEPVSITATKDNGQNMAMPSSNSLAKKKEAELFLGENSSLVNLDSGWKTYQVPYCTKPLATQSHNPFQQTGPTKTLNEMKSTKQTGFH